MPYADLRGARLFFTDEGEGYPIVFVHGFTCDSHDWSWQIPHFAEGHRVVALDLRGHGRSSAPEDGYEVHSLAADVIALIEHLGCAPAVMVGHSLGGAIVGIVGVARPDLVRAVVPIDPGCLIPDELGPELASGLAAFELLDPMVIASTLFDQNSHPPATPRWLATWHNRRAAGGPAHVLRKTLGGLLGGEKPFVLAGNSGPFLENLDRPSLSFWTEPARVGISNATFTHPQSRTVCFEGSGHWLHQERPLEVNTIIDSWLADLTSPALAGGWA